MQFAATTVTSSGIRAGSARSESKAQALSWLASQLDWERTLDTLRDGDDAVHGARAA